MSNSELTASAQSIMNVRRKGVRSPSEWVNESSLLADRGPSVLTPNEGIDLVGWTHQSGDFLRKLLQAKGALLLRAFGAESAEDFYRFALALSPNLLEYKERSSPRQKVQTNIYSSTEYPAHQEVFFHNENSYQLAWPTKLFFFCSVAPTEGGETPISDVRRVYSRLPSDIVRKFVEKQCMYVRNFDEALGLRWQEVFQTEDVKEVEVYCRKNDILCEWKLNGGLRTIAIRPAVLQHPQTNESLWFNHAAFFHVSTLDRSIREGLLAVMPECDLPSNSYYGDGTAIEPEVMELLRDAYRAESMSFAWQRGDILVLDNMSIAHSRAPFVGERKILVAMAEPYSR